ncbi:MAG TPA: hypothetical protein GXZ24_03885 [Firmicutes bacterium]|nr:hypothetical protein [Bacillota bacterium]
MDLLRDWDGYFNGIVHPANFSFIAQTNNTMFPRARLSLPSFQLYTLTISSG